ncbi:MAG: hypothetical protein JWM21_4993 [Acidobacteria bacterium]|nr:hypothetical protein [Acidobacteriota bacterium]
MADNTATGTTGSRTGSGLSSVPGNGGSSGSATGAATAIAQTAQEYAGKVSDAAIQAKDYVTDKVGVVSDKIKELDFKELTDNAKEYARQKPGQAILISAAAGLLLGILIRGRR